MSKIYILYRLCRIFSKNQTSGYNLTFSQSVLFTCQLCLLTKSIPARNINGWYILWWFRCEKYANILSETNLNNTRLVDGLDRSTWPSNFKINGPFKLPTLTWHKAANAWLPTWNIGHKLLGYFSIKKKKIVSTYLKIHAKRRMEVYNLFSEPYSLYLGH